jgi:hypothetical protein
VLHRGVRDAGNGPRKKRDRTLPKSVGRLRDRQVMGLCVMRWLGFGACPCLLAEPLTRPIDRPAEVAREQHDRNEIKRVAAFAGGEIMPAAGMGPTEIDRE